MLKKNNKNLSSRPWRDSRTFFCELRSQNKKGFTLIESIVALSILVIAIFACLQVLALGLKLAKSAKQKTIDVLSAQAQIEETLAKPYEEIPGEEVYPGLKKIEINNLKTYVAD